MKVSIITIVYNNRQCIADCIESVLNQTYPNLEHIVVDGGSMDGTQKEIERYKESLAYYISEKDNGLYNALNKGIKQATGDIIGLLHSDDLFYDKNSLRRIVSTFERFNADLVYAKGQYVDKNNTENIKRIYPSKPFRKRYLHFGWIPLHTTIYVKREVFEKYGLYEEHYRIASDYEISQRWFQNDKIKKIYLDAWVVKMRLGGKSTNPKFQQLKSGEDLHIIKRYELWGYFTLALKIARKIPQYVIPRLIPVEKTNPPLMDVTTLTSNLKPTIRIQIREALEYWGKIPRLTAFLFGATPKEEIQIPEELLPDHLKRDLSIPAGQSTSLIKKVNEEITEEDQNALNVG